MEGDELVQCYNKGCGQKFDPVKNSETSCRYHAGVPVFHDALKGWSCCKKRSTDFTEFLNIPGCTQGFHSNEKPPEPEKPASTAKSTEETYVSEVVHAPIKEPPPRPSEDEALVMLPMTVGASWKQALEKQMKELTVEDGDEQQDESVIKIGTSCKNKGCKMEYLGEESNQEVCVYHAGVPVFHEGMKYWSCCQRKTSDFNSFLDQEGCTSGQHLWKQKVETKKVDCRYDWHQTPSFVTISVFAKVADSHRTIIEANKVILKMKVVFDKGDNVFEERIVLNSTIDPAKSNVKLLGTKVEINLKKAEPGSWSRLAYPSES